MKKITEAELRSIIDDRLQDLWVELSDKLSIDVSLEELPHNGGDITEAIDNFTEKTVNFFDENGFISDGKHFKPQAFYTGGGIWLCGQYLDDLNYVTISNEDDAFGLSYFVNDDNDQNCDDIEFPCCSFVKFVPLEEMTKEELTLWKSLKAELEREMH